MFSSQVGDPLKIGQKKVGTVITPILQRGMNQIYDPENQEITDIQHLRPRKSENH